METHPASGIIYLITLITLLTDTYILYIKVNKCIVVDGIQSMVLSEKQGKVSQYFFTQPKIFVYRKEL